MRNHDYYEVTVRFEVSDIEQWNEDELFMLNVD